jgi:hypothetical protein
MEAAVGVEPTNRGFADLRLGHLATPPHLKNCTKRDISGQYVSRRMCPFFEIIYGCLFAVILFIDVNLSKWYILRLYQLCGRGYVEDVYTEDKPG